VHQPPSEESSTFRSGSRSNQEVNNSFLTEGEGRKVDEDHQIAEITLQDAGTFEFEEILADGKDSG